MNALVEVSDAVCDYRQQEPERRGCLLRRYHGICAARTSRGSSDRRINAATLLVTVLDTSIESQLGHLITREGIEAARAASRHKGVLEGDDLGRVFAWMRPNDLIWNYWVNNYLLGNDPPAFDLLYWNADTTRLPARLHSDFLDLILHKPVALSW